MGEIAFFTLRIEILIKIIAKVPTQASNISFKPINTPIAAMPQIVATVFNPFILLLSSEIVPAPKKLFLILLVQVFSSYHHHKN